MRELHDLEGYVVGERGTREKGLHIQWGRG
jgi:hypothetical protein